MHTTTSSRHRSLRSRRSAAAVALTLATVLAACGGGGSDDASSDAGDATTAPADAGTDGTSTDGTGGDDTGSDTGSEGTDGAVDDGVLPDVDICGAITQEDMAAILPEATLISAAPNDAIPAPTCDYNIELTGGFEAAVIQILLAAEEPSYLEGQRDIQTDAVDVPGLDDAFAYDDFGTIMVLGESGVFLVERGVELTEGGTAASQDQMIAIAERVAEL
jgi:hypothetical protein